ncbi:MAG TPA: hypothetical protein PKE06_18335 [Flavilitoribacter sp.]|nr:hypothetical protein [Flavilitoribacter sp.]HMQ90496.1 hypothetical protein [Flavilitoribacter sp.]
MQTKCKNCRDKTGNVQFIGGSRERMAGMDKKNKLNHLQEAFQVRYGKVHFPILIDLDSDIGRALNLDKQWMPIVLYGVEDIREMRLDVFRIRKNARELLDHHF